MECVPALGDDEIREVIRVYLDVLRGRGREFIWGPESLHPHPRDLISDALVAALERWPDSPDSESWWSGFVELERFLGDEDWSLVEEFERRAGEGPEAMLSMEKERMQAANGITREVSRRKIARMELLNGLSLFPLNSGPEGWS